METKRSIGYQAGAVVALSDDETLFAHIMNLSKDSALARAILSLAEHEHWTVQHTALAIAYTFILKDEDNMERIVDIVSKSTRPILMSVHCKTCTCTDKSVNYEDL